jgi:hypothetical protein
MKLQTRLAWVLTATFTLFPVLFASAGKERTKPEVEFKPTRVLEDETLSLTGDGIRTALLGIQVYAIAHYAPASAFKSKPNPAQVASSNVRKEIVMQFLRSVGANSIRESYEKSLKTNNTAETLTKTQAAVNQFLNTMNVSVKKGDQLILKFLPQKGLGVTTPMGSTEILSPELAVMVWNIWFGPEPPAPGQKLQKALIKNL